MAVMSNWDGKLTDDEPAARTLSGNETYVCHYECHGGPSDLWGREEPFTPADARALGFDVPNGATISRVVVGGVTVYERPSGWLCPNHLEPFLNDATRESCEVCGRGRGD